MTSPFISYARHGEDVVLWRALGTRDGVFYVHVGASDPTRDSATRALYERGWRGMNLEAHPDRIAVFQEERPEDINVAVAVGDRDGAVTLSVPRSPGRPSLGPRAATPGEDDVETIEVPMRRLSTIFAEHSVTGVDVLNVGVGGAEPAVVRGMFAGAVLPTVCVIEGIAAGGDRAAGDEAVALLVENGYTHCMFDGLNHYLTLDESLVAPLSVPANPLDGYVSHALAEATAPAASHADPDPRATRPRSAAPNATHPTLHASERAAPADESEAKPRGLPQASPLPQTSPLPQAVPPSAPADAPRPAGTAPDHRPRGDAGQRTGDRRTRRRSMLLQVLQGGRSSVETPRAHGVLRLGPGLASIPPRDAVTFLYRAILGRDPDPEGLAEWAGHVEAGLPVLHVARHFSDALEAALLPPAKREHIRAEVHRWGIVAAAIELGVDRGTPTFTPGRVAHEVFVRALFEVALQRPPSAEELDIQIQLIGKGATRETLIRSFASHPAARARFLGSPQRGLRARARAHRDRLSYLSTFRQLVHAAESRTIAAIAREAAELPDVSSANAPEREVR